MPGDFLTASRSNGWLDVVRGDVVGRGFGDGGVENVPRAARREVSRDVIRVVEITPVLA